MFVRDRRWPQPGWPVRGPCLIQCCHVDDTSPEHMIIVLPPGWVDTDVSRLYSSINHRQAGGTWRPSRPPPAAAWWSKRRTDSSMAIMPGIRTRLAFLWYGIPAYNPNPNPTNPTRSNPIWTSGWKFPPPNAPHDQKNLQPICRSICAKSHTVWINLYKIASKKILQRTVVHITSTKASILPNFNRQQLRQLLTHCLPRLLSQWTKQWWKPPEQLHTNRHPKRSEDKM